MPDHSLIFDEHTSTRWGNFTQLIIRSSAEELLEYLDHYFKEAELTYEEVTDEPENWENAFFLFEHRWEDESGIHVETILSEPETAPPEKQITDEFAIAFIHFIQQDAIFVASDNRLDLLQLITFSSGEIEMSWIDSLTAYQHLGASLSYTREETEETNEEEERSKSPQINTADSKVTFDFGPLSNTIGPSFVEFPNNPNAPTYDSAYDYMREQLGQDLSPTDDLPRYEFIEKVIRESLFVFDPSLLHVAITHVIKINELD